MADARSATYVLNDARARADMVGSQFVTDAQALTWISLGIQELRDFLIDEYGEDWCATISAAIAVSVGNQVQSFSGTVTDFFKLLGVDVSFDNGVTWRTCDRFPLADRNLRNSSIGWSASRMPRYRLFGTDQIMFSAPPDSASWKYRLLYIPSFILNEAAPNTTFDFVAGWNDWVACRVAIRMLQKEESDSSALERDLALIGRRVAAAVRQRDAGAPRRIIDAMRRGPDAFRDDRFDDEGW